eukprot:6089162-Pleurochrysis_carterae.AAC.1
MPFCDLETARRRQGVGRRHKEGTRVRQHAHEPIYKDGAIALLGSRLCGPSDPRVSPYAPHDTFSRARPAHCRSLALSVVLVMPLSRCISRKFKLLYFGGHSVLTPKQVKLHLDGGGEQLRPLCDRLVLVLELVV